MEPFIIDFISPHFSSLSHLHSLHISLFAAGLSFFSTLRCWLSFKSSKLLFVMLSSFISTQIENNFFSAFNLPLVFCLYGNTVMWRIVFVLMRSKSWIMFFACFTHRDKWTSWFIYRAVGQSVAGWNSKSIVSVWSCQVELEWWSTK